MTVGSGLRRVPLRVGLAVMVLLTITPPLGMFSPAIARAAILTTSPTQKQTQSASPEQATGSLESVASKASDTGRKVAMSLIGLAFAIAGVVMAFRRDFKEAFGIFVVGLIAIVMVTPAGITLLRGTVNTLIGSR